MNKEPDIITGKTLRSLDELREAGLLTSDDAAAMAGIEARYAIALPPAYAALIDPADPLDPIALQFLPQAEELTRLPHERDDPIGDEIHSPVPHLVHRYPDRVLIKLVSVCPVYCRFCFRREMVGPGGASVLESGGLDEVIAYIAAHPQIFEVIFTGGDPLALSARRIADVTQRVAAIPHVQVLRWHSRVPVATPEHITPELVEALKADGKAVYVALHANHPRELTAAAIRACALMIDAGIVMVSQSVLLKGVNDTVETLSALMRAFVAARIKPYYLHQGDLAPGTAHLRTDPSTGQRLMKALRGRLSGLCQPHYVLDIPGGFGKVPLTGDYLVQTDGAMRIEDIDGLQHPYPPRG